MMDELREAHYEQAEDAADSGEAQFLLRTLQQIELSDPSDGVIDMITNALTEITEAPEYCHHQTYSRTLETPAEYCEGITVRGSEYCKNHN